nr:DNA methyltransferase [Hansschlegelia zhihuaiae]
MRCIFTMFADGVDLLPRGSFTALLEECLENPDGFAPMLTELWARMDEKDGERFSTALGRHVRHFNGNLFSGARAFPLAREEIGELLAAARYSWTEVDPAIFGALLEQALDKDERRRLGAHYTPRAYVQRLVEATVMVALRADWQAALTMAEAAKEAGDERRAVAIVRAFLRKLCATRVLDPACGTGNFLYVALELMKALEGEALETLAKLGEPESMEFDRETVDPHQFLGLELNPRAAAIAELVVWIGYLQQHYRTRTGHPSEPILRAFKTINFGSGAPYDAVLTWAGFPLPKVETKAGRRVETYPNARRPEWPEAEFIVGNPPFIGGKDIRSRLSAGYAEALWRAHPEINESADYVMFWWDRAADLLTREGAALRRFGLVTTNSISQVFQRRVMERRLAAKTPLSLVYAVPDHPWTKATAGSAAVRIAMTVAEAGSADGVLAETTSERGLDTDAPEIAMHVRLGRINADLSIGVDSTQAKKLMAAEGLCSPGAKLHGAGFLISRSKAAELGLGRRPGLERHIRPYRNGRDLTSRPRDVLAIDLFGLSAEDIRRRFPEAYQHLALTVRPQREAQVARSATADAVAYLEKWWLFGKPRPELRAALVRLPRYIATVETAKHRVFQFLDSVILADNMLIVVADNDAATLAVLSSSVHRVWTSASGGSLEDRPRYTKSQCFDPFPFPDPSPALRASLAAAGEELDALRKSVQAEHPDITLTALYNVLEKLRAGAALTTKEESVKTRGLVLILKELHDAIDRLTHDAYGWPRDLAEGTVLERLVALNAERAREEAAGFVRWLRPDYQAPRFGKGAVARTGELSLPKAAVARPDRPSFPKNPYEQPLAIEAALAAAGRPLASSDIAGAFRGAGAARRERVDQALATLALYGRVTALGDGRYVAARGHGEAR